MIKTALSISLFLVFLLSSCGSEKKISKEVFDQVQEANEVKKLSEADIFMEAMEWGNEISMEMQ